MKRGIVYVRQSYHKKARDSQKNARNTVSPEVQEETCRALPEIKGCDVVKVERDLDISGGKVANRPAFLRILEGIRSDPPDVIAVYDQSRSFRNTTEALEFYALMERLPKIKVIFHIGSFERSAVGEFSYTTLAAAHTMERKMTGEKIQGTYGYLNARGLQTGAVPYGYRRAAEGSMIPEQAEAEVVRRVFEEYGS